MSDVIASWSENPYVLVALIFLLGAIVYALVKKLLKIAVVFVLGFIAVSVYFSLSGTAPPPALEKVQSTVKETLEDGAREGARRTKEATKKAAQAVGEEIERAAKEGVDRALGD